MHLTFWCMTVRKKSVQTQTLDVSLEVSRTWLLNIQANAHALHAKHRGIAPRCHMCQASTPEEVYFTRDCPAALQQAHKYISTASC